MHELKINPKFYPQNSVVYWVESLKNGMKYVEFGTVIDHFPGVICIQLYTVNKKLMVNGVYTDEFVTPSRWQKLPKNWTYDTPLISIGYEYPLEPMYDIKDPATIQSNIDSGVLIKNQDFDWAKFETKIDKDNGWRVVRKYPDHVPYYTTIDFEKVYDNYQAAKDELDAYEQELHRQSELTDEEWSIEQIDKALHRWMTMCFVPEDTVQKYRDWIMKLEHIEDVEIRMCGQNIQWKYWKNKRWNNIEL